MRFFLLALTIVLLGGCAATAPRPASLPDIVVSADALARGRPEQNAMPLHKV